MVSCTSYYEGTELKANHNQQGLASSPRGRCTSYYEGTELKANHNCLGRDIHDSGAVLAITKVLN